MRVAVIGVGTMGFHHARNFGRMRGAKLCAVADSDAKRAAVVSKRFSCEAYEDYRELLKRERPDAVSVAVPTARHLEVVRTLLEMGVHVLVEKPIAGNADEARTLVALAAQRGLTLGVGHVERFNPAVVELKRRVERGSLGTIWSVVVKRVGIMPPRVKDTNVIVDLAVHDIDILNFLLGRPPTDVRATAGCALVSNRYDHAELFLTYGSTGCFVQVNWITPLKIRTLSVTGDAGYAELNYVTQKLEVYESNVQREFDDFGEFVVRFGEVQKSVVPVQVQEPLFLELADFVSAVEEGRSPAVPGEAGIMALEVVERALKGIR